jgi:AcrR family transcriptional regulator
MIVHILAKRGEPLNREIRREQIMKAAMELIAKEGVNGFSMASLADKIGLVPSATYRHFKNKDEVLDKILDFIEKRLLDNTRSTCRETSESMGRLERILKRHVETLRENPAFPRIIFTEDVFAGDSERKNRVYRIIRGYLNALNKIIRDGQEKGQIRFDVGSETIALMFLGLIQPGAILWFLSNGKFDVAGECEKNWTVFREAIRAG